MKNNKSKQLKDDLFSKITDYEKDGQGSLPLRVRIRLFYICEMHKILKSFKRSPILSFILIIIYYSQVIGNLFTPQIIEELESVSQSSLEFIEFIDSFFKTFKLYPLFNTLTLDNEASEEGYIYFLVIGVFLNTLLILYICSRLIYYIFWQFSSVMSQSVQDFTEIHATKATQSQKLITFSDYCASFIFRIYLYLLAIPLIQLSMKIGIGHYEESSSQKVNEDQSQHNMEILLSIFVWLSTFFIMVLIQSNEYDYSFLIKDYLAQQKSYFVFIRIVTDIIGSGIYLSSSLAAIKIFQSINCLTRLAICFLSKPFNSPWVMSLVIQICSFYTILCLIVILVPVNGNESQSLISFSILVICSIPLSSKIGIILLNISNSDSTQSLPFLDKEIKKIKPIKFDRHFRNLINLFSLPYEEYMKDGQGVKFETIFANHLEQCQIETSANKQPNSKSFQDNNMCFCYQYQDAFLVKNCSKYGVQQKNQAIYTQEDINLAVSKLVGDNYRHSFLIKYANHLMQTFFNASSRNYQDKQLNVKPTYMYFLCQIAKTPAKAFQQIYLLREQMKTSSLQHQSMLQEIIDDINVSFSQFIHTSEFQNQRLSISAVFEFDYLFKDFMQSFKQALSNRQRYYEFLCSDYINLTELLKESEICLQTKRVTESKIRHLFDINPTHTRLLCISEIYIELFDFRKRRIRHFSQNSKQIMNRSLQRVDLKINLFDSSTCCIFISLHNKQITKVSNSTENFFKCGKNDLIGKQFSLLLPQFITPSFNKYIEQLLEEGNMDMIKVGEYLTFLNKPKTKYVIPIYLRTKLDILSNNEFGLSFQIQQGISCRVSVITDNNYNIISCTKEFQSLLFKFLDDSNSTRSFKQSFDQIKNSNLKNYIPLIYSFGEITQDINNFEGYNSQFGFKDQKIQNYLSFKSLLILPINKEAIMKLNKQTQSNHKDVSTFFQDFHPNDYEFLEITFSPFSYKLYTEQTPSIKILEIHSYKKLRTFQEINDLLSRLREALTAKFQQEINIPLFMQQNSPLQEENKYTSHLLLEQDKKYQNYKFLSLRSDIQLSETMKHSTRSNMENNNNSDQNEENYIEEAIINNNLNSESHLQFGYDPFAQIQEYRIPRKKESDQFESPQIGCSIDNIMDSQTKPRSFMKGGKDSKITKFDESLAATSRQSFLSPKYPQEQYQLNSTTLDNDYARALLVNQISSPLITSFNCIYNQEKSSRNNLEKTSPRKGSLQKLENSTRTDILNQQNLNPSQIEFQNQKNRSRFFSQKQKVQNGTSQNLLVKKKQNQGNIEKSSLESEECFDKGQEDDDGVIQLSYMQSKDDNKQKKHTQKSAVFEDEESSSGKKHKKHLNIVDDQQSVRSGTSQIFSKKQSLYEMISSRRDPTEIKLSKIVGIVAFLVIISISCVLFIQVQSNFEDEWVSYSNLTVGPDLLEGFAQILRIKELLTIIAVNANYGYLYSTFTPQEQLKFQKEAQEKLQLITTKIGDFQRNKINEGFADFMLNNETSLIAQSSTSTQTTLVNFTRMYSLMNLPLQLRMYLTKDDQLSRVFTYMNYNSFISTISTLQSISTDQARKTLTDTQQLLNLSIIITQIVIVFTVIIVFPVYSIIQQKKQDILRLLVTFEPSFLQSLVEKYKNALQSKQIIASISNFSKFDRSFTKVTKPSTTALQVSIFDFSKGHKAVNKSKKRQISHTNSLPKFSLRLSFLTFLIFIVMSLYSLLNYLLTKDFFDYFGYNIDELSLISQSKSYLALNYCGMYLLTNSYAYKFDEPTVNLIIDFFNVIILPNNQDRVNKYYSIDNNFIHNRYNLDMYKINFINVIKEDACSILNTTYSQSFLQDNLYVSPANCPTLFKGALSKGLTFTFKELFTKIQSYYSNYLLTLNNPLGFFKSIKQWDYDNNLKEFDLLYYYLRTILDSQSEFLTEQSKEYFDYLMSVQKGLFIYNLLIVSIVFLFVWRKFLKEMCDQVQDTTYLLSLMPIEQLLENSYVLLYLNKIKRSTKRN